MPQTHETLPPLRRFFRLLAPDTQEIRYLYLFSFINGLIALSLPLGIQAIMSIIVGGQVSSSWAVLLFLVGLGILANGSLTYFQSSISETLQRKLFARAAFDFAYRIPRLRLETIERQFAPELVNRFFDVLTLQKGLPKILIDFTNAVLQILLGLVLLSIYHPIFIILSLFIVIILVLIIALTSRKGLETSIYESKYKYKIVSWLEELARSMHSFKLAGQSPLPIKKTDYLVDNYLTYRRRHFTILMGQYAAFVFFRALVTVALLGVGSYLVINNSINLGQFVAAELTIILVLSSAEKIIGTMETFYDVLTAIDKIGYVTDIEIEKQSGQTLTTNALDLAGLSVRATNLSFKDAGDSSLHNLNFTIKSGEFVCLAGEKGSGKSILLQVIAGLYTHHEGVLAYNDIPIKNLNINALRNYIGNHSRQETIFEGSLFENISLGNPTITTEDVTKLLALVELKSYVEGLPEGLETGLLPTGQLLAESVIEKILLIRALVNRPKLLVIDDFEALNELFAARDLVGILKQNLAGCTVIIVSNEPRTQAACHQIFRLSSGKLAG